MAFERLTYEKDWNVTDPSSDKYFPTIETDELQVRADIQLLHDNAKDAINAIVDGLNDPAYAGDINIAAIPGMVATDVQSAFEELNSDIEAVEAEAHTHANKSLLDTYNQTNAALADAVSKVHMHGNLSELNTITAYKLGQYDALVNLLSGIDTITTDLTTGDDSELPTAAAVRALVGGIPNLDKIFVAVKDVTTYAQVQQAVAAGKAVFAYDGTDLYTYSNVVGTTYVFVMLASASATIKSLWLGQGDSWSEQSIPIAVLNSPTFTGTPQITTTPTTGDNSHKIADTAFVKQEISAIDLSGYMQKGVDYVTAGRNPDYGIGNKATAEGNLTTPSGDYSHTEGSYTVASGVASHAEGTGFSSGLASHAEGSATAEGDYSHAEGYSTYGTGALGGYSHAEGYGTKASGEYSHAEGGLSTASGEYSHAQGMRSIANHKSQFVFGENNVADDSTAASTERGKYVEIVGNGLNGADRSNARTLDWSGNEVLAGKLTVGSAPTANMDVATKKYVDDAIAAALANL